MTDKIVSNTAKAEPGNYSRAIGQNGHGETVCKDALTNVLIVDDCASTRLLLGHYARLRNFKISSAPSGEAALELAARQSFDLVFMDVSMPGIDGMETIRRMRQLGTAQPHTQFVICSGYTPHDLGSEQVEYGFLHKPICRQKFNRLMDELENEASPKSPFQPLDQFDDTILNSIFDEAGDPLKYRICSELCNDINRHVNHMLTADKQQNLTAFERATHALKGISGTFGAESLHRLAHQGNQMARNARPDDAFNLATKIEASALLALDNIQRFFVPENQPPAQKAGHNHE